MASFFKNNKFYYGMIAFLVLAGGILLLIVPRDVVSLWINCHYCPLLDWFFLTLNWIGEPVFSAFIVIAVWIFKGWKVALKAVACFGAVLIITQSIKYGLFPGKLRPTSYFEENILRLLEGVVQLKTESFPSGHTSAAFSIATFLALLGSRKKKYWVLALIAALVGYGRIYLSQHFITDVYAGMIVGVAITTLVYYFYPKKWDVESW